jgi:protein-disulfide isomerase
VKELSPVTTTRTRTSSRAAQQRAARAAAAAEQARRQRRRIVLGAVCAVLALAAGIGILVGTQSGGTSAGRSATPPSLTAAGGIVVGSPSAPVKVIAYEDPQCPVCARFERGNGAVLAEAVEAGRVSVEYRMRSFLGPESVRAVNALAAAQEAGSLDALRRALYQHQPQERTGGYTTQTLLDLGRDVGITSSSYADAVRGMQYEAWVRRVDDRGSRDGNVQTPELRVGSRVLTQDELFDEARFRAALGL